MEHEMHTVIYIYIYVCVCIYTSMFRGEIGLRASLGNAQVVLRTILCSLVVRNQDKIRVP